MGINGKNANLKIHSTKIDFDVASVSVQKLIFLRRSFIKFSKLNPTDDIPNISGNFINFLNSSLQE